MYLTLLSIQIVTFLLYVGFIMYRYGVIHSISASYYHLPKKQQPLFWAFTTILGFTMIFMSPLSVWFFVSGAGLMFVGTAAAFEDWRATAIVHYIGASVGIGSAMLAIFLLSSSLLPVWIMGLFTAVSLLFDYKRTIWWLEIGAFVGIAWTLLIMFT